MTMKLTTFNRLICAKGTAAPERFVLFTEGEITFDDLDPVLVDEEAFKLIKAEFERRGNDMVIDYEHQTLEGVQAPAAGWIKGLEYKKGVGVIARVEWTRRAKEYFAEREYRYFSPVFYSRKSDNRVYKLDNVALTNAPRTNSIPPIVAKTFNDEETNKTMDLLNKLIELLGLEAEATDADVLAAISALASKGDEPAAANTTVDDPVGDETAAVDDAYDALAAAEAAATAAAEAASAIEDVLDDLAAEGEQAVASKAITKSLGLPANASVSHVVARIQAAKQNGHAAKRLAKVEAELAAIKTENAHTRAEKLVTKALSEGKIIPKQKPEMLKYALTNPAGFAEFIAVQPRIVPVDKLPTHVAKAAHGNDEFDESIGAMFGVTKDDFNKYGRK